jgi:hypothetical protein
MESTNSIRCQGRTITGIELQELQTFIDTHPEWSRHRVCVELCQKWEWRTVQGQLKTFAAREMLLKLEQRVGLRLPALQEQMQRRPWGISPEVLQLESEPQPMQTQLADIQPLDWQLSDYGTDLRKRALGYLRAHHYLGCDRPVGSHLLYLVRDRLGRDLAVHLVGAAAWQCADRDRFIGWTAGLRNEHLRQVANHSRFLILPWVQVKGLASHLLGQLTQRLPKDWLNRHGVRLALLESFVQKPRFEGTCYRAANWQRVGQTTGRTRQEKHHRASKPRKTIWLYPLQRDFRTALGVTNQTRSAQ